MDRTRVRRLFAAQPVARLGTIVPGGHPILLPVPFAVIDDADDGVIVCAFDQHPRSIAGELGLRQIAGQPRVSLLADRADRAATDPADRWWVQADAVAEVLRDPAADPRYRLARRTLRARYGRDLPDGPIVWATVVRWFGWTVPAELAEHAA